MSIDPMDGSPPSGYGSQMQFDPRAKRSPFPVLAGPDGHPFHPMAVTVPIGAWVSSLVFDIGAQIDGSRASTWSDGARWLIAIGIIGALVAALLGLLDLVIIPPHTPAQRTALTHAALNAVVIIGFVVDYLWRGSAPSATHIGPIVLTAVCLALLGVSGSLGGRLAYRYGIRVEDEETQAVGFRGAATPGDRATGEGRT